ncbi:hypothetical protein JCM6882_003866 [Rhodosporidiobolus microsporus]
MAPTATASTANDAPSKPSPSPSPHPDPPSSRDSSVLTCAGVPLPPADKLAALPTLTRAEIAGRISRGDLLILHPPLVYRVPHSWLKLHPGGHHSLLHYVGRDASCEIEAYHSGRTVKERMARWVVGKVEVDESETGEGWRDMVPPIQLGMWPIPVPDIKVFSPPPSPIKERHPSLTLTPTSSNDGEGDEKIPSPAEPQPRLLTPEMIDPPLSPADYDKLPLTPAYQAHLRRSHRQFMARIHSLGLDAPPPFLAGYSRVLLIYAALLALAVWSYRRAETTVDYVVAAVALGAFWHQITFVVHDFGHSGMTGDWWTDRVASISVAGLMGGLSAGWWCDNHNVHHLVTNAPEHDPDIQHLPFFAITTKFFNSLRSTYYDRILVFDAFAKRLIPHQHKLWYPIMALARLNLFALSYGFLARNWPGRRSPLFKLRLYEIACIAVFYVWFGGGVLRAIERPMHRWVYLVVSFAVTSPLHVQIVLSHFSQPVSILPPSSSPSTSKLPLPLPAIELLESHPHRQLRTTMDISCPAYLDFLHGGLNFQTPHHLFPRLFRFRFRAISALVAEWVEQENAQVETREDGSRWWKGFRLGENEGLVYKKMTFVEGNKDVLGLMRDVGAQVKLLAQVAKADAKGELHHH